MTSCLWVVRPVFLAVCTSNLRLLETTPHLWVVHALPDGIQILNPNANHNMYCVKLQKVIIWLEAVRTNVVQPTE
jgi:hypothetical protein